MISWRVPALLVGLGVPTIAIATALGARPWLPLGVLAGVLLLVAGLDWLVAAPAGEVQLHRNGPT